MTTKPQHEFSYHIMALLCRDSLTFGDFVKFSNDLQTEVLSIEFFEFAKGDVKTMFFIW